MDSFKIFTKGEQVNDSGSDSGRKELPLNIFGKQKTPSRGRNFFSRDLNLSVPQKSQSRASMKKSVKMLGTETTEKSLKRSMKFLRPTFVNTLDKDLEEKRKKQQMSMTSSSEEKAGNENQENNNSNWVDPSVEKMDVKKEINENKTMREDLSNTMQQIAQRVESAQRKVAQRKVVQKPILEKVSEQSEEKSISSNSKSGIKNTKKTLNFDTGNSPHFISLEETPQTLEPKTEEKDVEIKRFESLPAREERKISRKASNRPASKMSQNYCRTNLRGGYQQKDRRIKMRYSKQINKRKRILDDKFNNLKYKKNGAAGGFGSEGLDGAFVSDAVMENRSIPQFSPNFTFEFERSEPLEVPSSDEGYLQILKEKFEFDEFFEGQLDSIKSIVQDKNSCLAILSTGGGKSLIYQY
jgi:hypothetical protein